MKLTLFLSILTISQLWATETYSQMTKLTLKLENVTISDALKEIENESEFFFLYSPKLIDVEKRVNIDARDETIKDILAGIFDEKVKFAVYDRQVILTPIESSDHEVEIAVVIGRKGRNIKAAEAAAYIAGYCIGLDMTIRGPEERSYRKSPDSYSVLGPWLVTADEIPDASKLQVSIRINDELRQDANTEDLVIDIPGLVEMASNFYTLHPGDVIYTGTPQGVGPVRPGDTMTATIERIGTMRVAVTAA